MGRKLEQASTCKDLQLKRPMEFPWGAVTFSIPVSGDSSRCWGKYQQGGGGTPSAPSPRIHIGFQQDMFNVPDFQDLTFSVLKINL